MDENYFTTDETGLIMVLLPSGEYLSKPGNECCWGQPVLGIRSAGKFDSIEEARSALRDYMFSLCGA